MFRVAICDDEATSLLLNKALTEKILNEEQIEYEISTFDDMEVMIKALTSGTVVYDCLLSDILTVGMNGIEAAEKLRELGERLAIIFISTTAEYALDGYRVRALRYLQKPVNIEALRECLKEVYREKDKKEYLSFKKADKYYRIPLNVIVYLESCGRELDIVTTEKTIRINMKISDVEKLLPNDHFYKCHRSYIINLDKTRNAERYQVVMQGGQIVPISQALYTDALKKIMQYS